MTRRAEIEILGDASSFAKAARESAVVANSLAGDMDKLAVNAKASANVQIQASLRKDARLREEIAAYKLVAASAEKGSREQIAAANLAERAQHRLAGSYSVTAHESARLSSSSRGAEREVGRATRGALAGSGVFRAFGRSLAFASGGFLAFASGGQLLRSSITAAREAEVTQRQLDAQLAVSGKSLAQYRGEIDKTNLRLSALSGFTKEDLDKAFITILRTTGNVAKSLRDVGTAAALSRAKPNLGLNQSATIIAKVEAGNTTLLRRQGFEIDKNATKTQALAAVRRALAGQLAAGTTQEQRFSAVLHDSEVILGEGLLPTLNKYLTSGSRWLQQMNESGKLQRNVATATHEFGSALHDVSTVIRDADRVTGSFKNTLELFFAFKLVSKVASWAGAFRVLTKEEEAAGGRAAFLASKLKLLAGIGVITIGVDLIFHAKGINQFLRDHIPGLAGIQDFEDKHNPVAHFLNKNAPDVGVNVTLPPQLVPGVAGGVGEHGALLTNAAQKAATAAADATKVRTVDLTVAQRNTFFDNAIARILQRGGLGTIQQQIASLQKADVLIAARLKTTKDVTRRLNLEDQLLQNAAQIKGLNEQAAQDALQKRQEASQNFLDALQFGVTKAQATAGLADDLAALKALQDGLRKEMAEQGKTLELRQQLFDAEQQSKQLIQQRRDAAQFFTLGLGPTGDTRIPLAATLKKRLGTISEAVSGTFLDTSKNQALFKNIRKILTDVIPPSAEMRAKIRDLLDGIRQELDKGAHNLTKFRHVDSDAFVKSLGLGLTPDQVRVLRSGISQLGAGNTAPGRASSAFDLVGAGGTTVVHTQVNLDGQKVAVNTTKHQERRRTPSRRN
jgi:hypothetical protein